MRTFKQYINDTEDTVLIPGAYMVPRSQMPQIHDQKSFLNYIVRSGAKWSYDVVSVDSLKPLQSFVDRNKVKKFTVKHIYKTPIIVSSDNFILDGHHRYFAALESTIQDLTVIRVALNINKLFQLTQEYLEYAA
jgi:hypothetical protein